MNQDAGSGKARLRIDVLRDAADMMIDQLIALNNQPDSLLDIRVQTNGFGLAYEKGFGPSTDTASLKSSIRNFTVANSHTSFLAAMTGFATALGSQGDGTTAAKRNKVALLITDGVRDEGFDRSQLGPITPSLCDMIKSKGIDLAVLEIKYVQNYDAGGYFRDRVSWYYPNISPNLQSCASQGLYYLATDSNDAANQLLKLAKALTQKKLRVTT